MTSKEALKELKEEGIYLSNSNANEVLDAIEKDLDLLDLYKKFFKYSLTEIQGIKYLTLPNNSDIRIPDSMIKITDEEYELLKEGLER